MILYFIFQYSIFCAENGLQKKIMSHIIHNKPTIAYNYAHYLSELILIHTNKHGVDARIYTAILMQESGYRLNVYTEYDYGISQINIHTIRVYKMDPLRLLNDLSYSVEMGAVVLGEITSRYKAVELEYWTRYNASSPSKREIYRKLVERYL